MRLAPDAVIPLNEPVDVPTKTEAPIDALKTAQRHGAVTLMVWAKKLKTPPAWRKYENVQTHLLTDVELHVKLGGANIEDSILQAVALLRKKDFQNREILITGMDDEAKKYTKVLSAALTDWLNLEESKVAGLLFKKRPTRQPYPLFPSNRIERGWPQPKSYSPTVHF